MVFQCGGKDFKTGQTLMKTNPCPRIACAIAWNQRWFSTNILGNRDGLVLDDPDNFKTKEVSKLSVLEDILQLNRTPIFTESFIIKFKERVIIVNAIL